MDPLNNHGLSEVITISPYLLKKIKSIILNDPYTVSLLQTLVAQLLGNGTEMFITTPTGKKATSKDFEKYIDRELSIYLQQFILDCYMFGFTISIPSKSKYVPQIPVPIHPRLGDWQLQYGYKKSIRRYLVKKVRTTYNPNGEVWKNAIVSVVFEPTDDGQLTSPLYTALQYIMLKNNILNDIENTSNANANPALITEITTKGPSSIAEINTIATSKYIEDDIINMANDYNEKMNEFDFEALKRSTALAHDIKTGVASFDGDTIISKRKQQLHTQALPANQKVAKVTQPKVIQNVDSILEMIMNQISNILGVSSKQNSTTISYSANVELDLKIVNERLAFIRNRIISKVEEVFETMWKMFLKQEKNEIVETLKKEHNMEFFNKAFHKKLKANIGVEISFKYIPIADLNRINDLHERGLLEYDAYADTVIKMVGLPLSAKAKHNPSEGRLDSINQTNTTLQTSGSEKIKKEEKEQNNKEEEKNENDQKKEDVSQKNNKNVKKRKHDDDDEYPDEEKASQKKTKKTKTK